MDRYEELLSRIADALEDIAQNLSDVTMIDHDGDAFLHAYAGDEYCKQYDMDGYAEEKAQAQKHHEDLQQMTFDYDYWTPPPDPNK